MNKQAVIFWVIIVIAAFGLITWVGDRGIFGFIVPIVVLGGIFLLYKFPPGRWARKAKPKIKPSARTMAKVKAQSGSGARKSSGSSKKRKDYPFHVIQGNKGKSDDDIPKFH
ncbi:hypothetical protein [Paenibacillus illinoisensis]|uniref:hypothetical protein n=1 Tax=Paenibacillus illinoisensis TaxID=59845 RepID=UPI00203CCB4A|nr:hypothetical protein [Paenibacillus illinoisensis]MCM3208205.1 hypothetical protein [Paenibacillus illinoisensis]